MKTPIADALLFERDEVFELLLQVARRADAIDLDGSGLRPSDRGVWLRAEWEVLEQIERARPSLLTAEWARCETAVA